MFEFSLTNQLFGCFPSSNDAVEKGLYSEMTVQFFHEDELEHLEDTLATEISSHLPTETFEFLLLFGQCFLFLHFSFVVQNSETV